MFRSHDLSRHHSRASSVDRREIFSKYITFTSEHSGNIQPCEKINKETKSDLSNISYPLTSIPPSFDRTNFRQSLNHDFRFVRLSWGNVDDEEIKTLGIFIARVKDISDNQSVANYFIVYIDRNGLVWR
jgi:hypothetical protein